MKYCSTCGQEVAYRIPPGDSVFRFICDACEIIHYQNPRMIVGCLPRHGSRVLLCRRAIEPQRGRWTLPSGFLENGETVEEGACRETYEEALARVRIDHLLTVYSIPHINQIYLLFLAQLEPVEFGAGAESLEVKLFEESEIPWEEIAFTSVHFALHNYFDDLRTGPARLHRGSFEKKKE